MSVSILSNQDISIIANFAHQHGLGSAQMIGELLHNQNVKTSNDRYSENMSPNFTLTSDTDSPESVINLVNYWLSNSWTDIQQSATFIKIRDILSFAVFPKKGEQTYSDFIGRPVWYRYIGRNQVAYISNRVNDYIVELLTFSEHQSEWVTLNISLRECNFDVDNVMGFQLSTQQVVGLKERLKEKRDAQRKAVQEQERKLAEQQEAFNVKLKDIVPPDSKAVIIAELLENKCGHNDDYYGSATKRRVLLSFSKHTRNLFPEMRKAASVFEPTAYLATADEKAEHRENYSMGRGTYLMQGSTYGGWRVRKEILHNGVVPTAEILDIRYSVKSEKSSLSKKVPPKKVPPKKEYDLELGSVAVDNTSNALTVSLFQQPSHDLVNKLSATGFELQNETRNVFRAKYSDKALECAIGACTNTTAFML